MRISNIFRIDLEKARTAIHGLVKTGLRILQTPCKFLFRAVRNVGPYFRFVLVVAITATAAIFGFNLRPHNYPIPTTTATHPSLDVLSNRSHVGVTVSRAYLAQQYLSVDMSISTEDSLGSVMLYVELSGVKPESYLGQPYMQPHSWSMASDNNGDEYSVGHSYSLKANSYYNIRLDFEFANCDCYTISGPYIAISPLYIDPLLLGPQQSSSDGNSLTRVNAIPQPAPDLGPGKYYETSLQSIGQDEVDLSGTGVSSDLAQMAANPQNPESTESDVWSWNNVAYANGTFSDPGVQDSLGNRLFYDGIFLGIVGAGLLAGIPRTSSFVKEIEQRRAGRRKNLERESGPRRQETIQSSPVTASRVSRVVDDDATPRVRGSRSSLWPILGVIGGTAVGWIVGQVFRSPRQD